jgi:hypothetical protein
MDKRFEACGGVVRPFTLVPALMTTRQAAAWLCVSPRTLEDWRLRGGGPTFRKLGRSVRYAPSDLQAFIDHGRFENTGQALAA